jgi:hypothetical protein
VAESRELQFSIESPEKISAADFQRAFLIRTFRLRHILVL